MDEYEELSGRISRGAAALSRHQRAAAVAVALTPGKNGETDVVLEVRASTLEKQPGEVCLPGGHVEPGETPAEAAVRETREELLLSPTQVHLLGGVGTVTGPGGLPLHVFALVVSDYEGTFSADEVASVFTLSLKWLLGHDPVEYPIVYRPEQPEDFPWELVEGGRSYHWEPKRETMPFYDTDPVIWGATARALQLFSRVMRAGAAE